MLNILFSPKILSVSLNVMHFVRTFLILRALGVRLIVIEKVRNYGEIVFIKNMFQNGWWGDASPTPSPLDPPLPALITMSNHCSYKPVWLQYNVRQFCHRLTAVLK